MLYDDFLNDGEAQTRSICLGGVEGYKNLGKIIGRYTRPIIRNRDALQFTTRPTFNGALDFNMPAKWLPACRFRGVASEIQKRLAQQTFISADALEFAMR